MDLPNDIPSNILGYLHDSDFILDIYLTSKRMYSQVIEELSKRYWNGFSPKDMMKVMRIKLSLPLKVSYIGYVFPKPHDNILCITNVDFKKKEFTFDIRVPHITYIYTTTNPYVASNKLLKISLDLKSDIRYTQMKGLHPLDLLTIDDEFRSTSKRDISIDYSIFDEVFIQPDGIDKVVALMNRHYELEGSPLFDYRKRDMSKPSLRDLLNLNFE